jgi:hypothetical protein
MKTKTDVPLTQDLRDTLKTLMQQEIARLPELLDELEPKDRLVILCKLLPYVFPRVEAVHQVSGEPMQLL